MFLWLRTIQTLPHLGSLRQMLPILLLTHLAYCTGSTCSLNHTTQPSTHHPLPHSNLNLWRRVGFTATPIPFQCVQFALAATNIVSSHAPKRLHEIGGIKPFFTWTGKSLFTHGCNPQQICMKWQWDGGCHSKHSHLHVCSGCGEDAHRAASCPRAQKVETINPYRL